MDKSIELSLDNMSKPYGGPFGAVLVDKDTGTILGMAGNAVTHPENPDPTAHAEIRAIRDAVEKGNTNLKNAILYTSCEPCPMCLAQVYRKNILEIVYGNTKEDAAEIDFDDAYIYEQLALSCEERDIPFVDFSQEENDCPSFPDEFDNYGTLIIKKGTVIGYGNNSFDENKQLLLTGTEAAIQMAGKKLKEEAVELPFQLTDCEVIFKFKPGVFEESAMFWARPEKVFYTRHGNNELHHQKYSEAEIVHDALQNISSPDRKIPTRQMSHKEALKAFEIWSQRTDKIEY